MCVRTARLARGAISALLATSLLSGCATFGGPPAPAALGAAKHRSIKDDLEPAAAAPATKRVQPDNAKAVLQQPSHPTCATGSDCMVRLKAMIDDRSRTWINSRPPAAEYANGTRLFAYRALRDRLSCTELRLALSEIEAAERTFRSSVPGVDAGRATHVLSLNAEVGQELRAESRIRCSG
jgi:hypothetical protein